MDMALLNAAIPAAVINVLDRAIENRFLVTRDFILGRVYHSEKTLQPTR